MYLKPSAGLALPAGRGGSPPVHLSSWYNTPRPAQVLTQERICLFMKVEEQALLSGPWLQTVPSREPECIQQVLSKCTM